MHYIIRNKRTGWVGSVSERIYQDRMRHKDEYEDASASARIDDSDPEVYTLQDKGGGWFDVLDVAGDVVNEKALRRGSAIALIEKLDGNPPSGA